MDKENKKIIALGKGSGGGGGDAVWGSITGTLSNQTDLMNELNLKVNSSSLATVATTGSYSDLTNTPTIPAAQIQSDWNQSDNTQLDFIKNKPTIPAAVSGTNDGTNWTSLTVGSDTYGIPSGGGNDWFGTKEMFDAIPENELDDDTNYYIADRLDYSDIANTPSIPSKTSDITNDSDFTTNEAVNLAIYNAKKAVEDSFVFCTQSEYDAMSLAGTLKEDTKYFIQGTQTKLQMVVTFTDQSTATYNVYVE